MACWVVIALLSAPAAAQSFYAGAGLGATTVLDAGEGAPSVYRQFYAVLGFETQGPVGIRVEGAESWGFLWLSGDLTYRFGGGLLQPYAFAGGGLRVTTDQADPIITAGAGLRVPVRRPLSVFAEGRLQQVFSVGTEDSRLSLPVTVGLSLGSR